MSWSSREGSCEFKCVYQNKKTFSFLSAPSCGSLLACLCAVLNRNVSHKLESLSSIIYTHFSCLLHFSWTVFFKENHSVKVLGIIISYHTTSLVPFAAIRVKTNIRYVRYRQTRLRQFCLTRQRRRHMYRVVGDFSRCKRRTEVNEGRFHYTKEHGGPNKGRIKTEKYLEMTFLGTGQARGFSWREQDHDDFLVF